MTRSRTNGLCCFTWPVAGAVLALLAGCRTLPNTQPFTDATGSLRSAVASVGGSVGAGLSASPLLKREGVAFAEAWQKRNDALAALVAYAQSVQAIVEAGQHGEEAATRLSEAAKKLATTVGVIAPGGSAGVDLAADTVKLVSGEVARFRAAKTIEKSLADMQPVIDAVAWLLAKDLAATGKLIAAAAEQERVELSRLPGNGDSDDYRRELVSAQTRLQKLIAVGLSKAPPIPPEQAAQVAQLDDIMKKIAQLDESAPYKAYRARTDDLAKREKLARELVTETAVALGSWAAAHGQMLMAVQTRRTPGAVELLAAVGRVQGLLERYRQL